MASNHYYFGIVSSLSNNRQTKGCTVILADTSGNKSGNIGQNVKLNQNSRIIWKQDELTHDGLQTVKIWAASAKVENSGQNVKLDQNARIIQK